MNKKIIIISIINIIFTFNIFCNELTDIQIIDNSVKVGNQTELILHKEEFYVIAKKVNVSLSYNYFYNNEYKPNYKRNRFINYITIRKIGDQKLIIKDYNLEVYQNKTKLIQESFYSQMEFSHDFFDESRLVKTERNVDVKYPIEVKDDDIFFGTIIDTKKNKIKIDSILDVHILFDYEFNDEKGQFDIKFKMKYIEGKK